MALQERAPLIPNIQRDTDTRGGILSIVDEPVKNVSIITCTAGAIRSNHYHHTDWHLMYVLEGRIDYFFRDVDGAADEYIWVKKGDNVFSPPKRFMPPTTHISAE